MADILHGIHQILAVSSALKTQKPHHCLLHFNRPNFWWFVIWFTHYSRLRDRVPKNKPGLWPGPRAWSVEGLCIWSCDPECAAQGRNARIHEYGCVCGGSMGLQCGLGVQMEMGPKGLCDSVCFGKQKYASSNSLGSISHFLTSVPTPIKRTVFTKKGIIP